MEHNDKSVKHENRSKAAKILSAIVIVPIVLLLVLTVFLSVKSFSGDAIPDVFGWKYLVVLTGSMKGNREDSFDAGAVVVIKETPVSELKVDDIITYRTDKAVPTTHRIVEITSNGIITRGDDNNTNDLSVVGFDDIEGRVVFSIPKVGYVIQYLKTPFGIAALFVFSAAVIFVSMLFDKNKPDEKNT